MDRLRRFSGTLEHTSLPYKVGGRDGGGPREELYFPKSSQRLLSSGWAIAGSMVQPSVNARRKFWQAPLWFLVEVLTGTIIFLLIAGGAFALNIVLHRLEAAKIDSFLIYGLRGAEYALFSADLILFARFLFVTVRHTWNQLQ